MAENHASHGKAGGVGWPALWMWPLSNYLISIREMEARGGVVDVALGTRGGVGRGAGLVLSCARALGV